MKKAKGAEPRSEEEQYAALQKYIHKGKSVTAAKMKEFRRSATNKTGWNAAQVDAVIEEFVEAKWVITPWTLERELAQLARGATNNAETEHQMLKARVKHRLDENGSGTLSAAQFATLKDNLRGKTQTGLAVEAVVWELEREGVIEVEDVVRGRGGADRREWREEARVWAVQRGWVMPAEAATQQSPIPRREAVCIEMGSGYEGASDGLVDPWDRLVTVDAEVHTISAKGAPLRKSNPDLHTTFHKLAVHRRGAIMGAAERAGVRKGNVGGMWLSLSCRLHTSLQVITVRTLNSAQFMTVRAVPTLTLTLESGDEPAPEIHKKPTA